ncbi:MAG: hypothetical protein KF901_07575 [Myxococcales bacterium]|nr:hypothetical protein [Myxococcales bacterium]
MTSPPVGAHALAAAVVSSLPVPLLAPRALQLVRGAALRRVAHARSVRLTREARAILARPPEAVTPGGIARRVVGAMTARIAAPLLVAQRVEAALGVLVDARLLDRHLGRRARRAHAPLGADEARAIVAAVAAARRGAAWKTLVGLPRGGVTVAQRTGRAIVGEELEDRTPIERVVDALLDAAADVPGDLFDALARDFDAASPFDALGASETAP